MRHCFVSGLLSTRPVADRSGRRARPGLCRTSSSASAAEIPDGWWEAAASADIRSLTQMVRLGQVTNPLAQRADTGRTALHLAVAAAQDLPPADANAVVSAMFEIARGVGGASAQYRHREDLAQALLDVRDAQGQTALALAEEIKATPGGQAALLRLHQLGAKDR